MMSRSTVRIGIVRRPPGPEENPRGGPSDRIYPLFDALRVLGAEAQAVTFEESRAGEVRAQLLDMDAVLVFVDPLSVPGDLDRSVLDPLLLEVADSGVAVSTHPDVILKMGTKEVLYETRDLAWGSDVERYRTLEEFVERFPRTLALRGPRVLKQYRGNGGNGVWKVALTDESRAADAPPTPSTVVRVLHALRGSTEEDVTLEQFAQRCAPYFEGEGRLIDQPYLERLGDGQVRVYLCEGRVVGFGQQKVAALMPAPSGSRAPEPEPRYYFGPDLADLQPLRRLMEEEWVPAMQAHLDLRDDELPLLWDADFLCGPPMPSGEDTYVLCEINVSSVIPHPEEAAGPVAAATIERARATTASRGSAQT